MKNLFKVICIMVVLVFSMYNLKIPIQFDTDIFSINLSNVSSNVASASESSENGLEHTVDCPEKKIDGIWCSALKTTCMSGTSACWPHNCDYTSCIAFNTLDNLEKDLINLISLYRLRT